MDRFSLTPQSLLAPRRTLIWPSSHSFTFPFMIPNFPSSSSTSVHPCLLCHNSALRALRLALSRATRFHDGRMSCRFGCQSLGNMYHRFVHCPFKLFNDALDEYLKLLLSDTQRMLSYSDEPCRGPSGNMTMRGRSVAFVRSEERVTMELYRLRGDRKKRRPACVQHCAQFVA